jgi:WD40 repeat protein
MVVDATQSRDRTVWAFAIRPKQDHPERGSGGWVELRRWRWEQVTGLLAPRGLDNLDSASLSPDGARIACVHGYFTLSIFDLATGRELASSPITRGGTRQDLAWSPDGRLLALVQDRCFTLLSAADLREIARVPDQYPSAVAFAPDGRLVALGSWEKGQVVPLADLLASEHVVERAV